MTSSKAIFNQLCFATFYNFQGRFNISDELLHLHCSSNVVERLSIVHSLADITVPLGEVMIIFCLREMKPTLVLV